MSFDPLTNRRKQYGLADEITELHASIGDAPDWNDGQAVRDYDEKRSLVWSDIGDCALKLVELVNAERAWRGAGSAAEPSQRALERILSTARQHEARDKPSLRIITTNWLIEVCEEGLQAEPATRIGGMMDATEDPKIIAAVKNVNAALIALNELVGGTNLACGLEDVLDSWDAFAETQFDINWAAEFDG